MEYLCHPLGELSQDPNFWFYTYSDHMSSGELRDTRLDMYAPIGSPVYAMMPGIIETSMYDSFGGGEFIKLKSTENNYSRITGLPLYLRYMHLSERLVNEGDSVQAGDLIGYSGKTGKTSGPHLHLDMSTNGYNPLQYPVIDNNVMNHLIPEYNYEANRTREVPNIEGGPGVPYGDNYYYHLFGSPVVQVSQSGGDTPPSGGIEYVPSAYDNERGGKMIPAQTAAYGSQVMSGNFMGAYPETLSHLNENLGLKMAYLICSHEYNESEEGLSYAKLLRARIIYHKPEGDNTSFRQSGATLETFCRWWQAQGWGSYNIIIEAQQKQDWDLAFAQNIYNNIKYGPAFGLTKDYTIKSFQGCCCENLHDWHGNPGYPLSEITNLAPNPEFVPGYYYVMFLSNGFYNSTANETNPAIME